MNTIKKILFLVIFVFICKTFFVSNILQGQEIFEQRIQALIRNEGELNYTEILHRIFDLYMDWRITSYPEFATLIGRTGQNHRWTDRSVNAIKRRDKECLLFLKAIKSIKESHLNNNDQLNYRLFKANIEMTTQGIPFKSEYMPINQLGGVQIQVPRILESMPHTTAEDYQNILARLQAIPHLIDQIIVLLNKGLEEEITPPQIILSDVPQQVLHLISDNPEDCILYRVFHNFPDSIPPQMQNQIRTEAVQILSKKVFPAFRKLHNYLTDKYIPQTRKSIGMSQLPEGKDWYAFKVYQHTTTNLSPEKIHSIGLAEVKRIQKEMKKIISKTGFEGEFSDFIRYLYSDQQFFFEKPEDLLIAYRDIAKRAEPQLMKLFGKLPRLPYGVVAVPAYKEKSQPTAYYEPGSHEAHRPGLFFVNTYDLKNRPKWEMEVLTFHEAVPGHHLQISLERELEDVPEFRKYGGYTVFSEGWGLYAESLGEELGFYRDPYAKFGQLAYEIWRAVRLVVDTGIHAMNWNRKQAIEFFEKHTALPKHDIIVEVNRYIAIPGQALAYKIGERKIKALRSYCEKELGTAFDIRTFHDTLLKNGSIPLEMLESQIKNWVKEQKGKE